MAELWKKAIDWGGTTLWIVVFAIILVIAWQAPDARSVVVNYRFGAEMFLAGHSPYNIKVAMGYLYAPAFAALYVPFLHLGAHWGDTLWRVLSFAVLTYAVYRQMRRIGPQNAIWFLSCTLFLALPVTAGALRNGQATILLIGACWLMTLSALEGRRAELFFWTSVALIAKPTVIVLMLLLGAIRPRLIPAMLLALVTVLVLPYAFGPFEFVNRLNRDFFALMTAMSVDKSVAFVPADFTAVFAEIGAPISTTVATLIRMVVGLATLGAVVWFDRRLEHRLKALVIFLIAAAYMCVFNPRVESNTYAMVAVPAGMAIAYIWQQERGGALRIVLAGALLLSGMTGILREIHDVLQPWFRAVAMTAITMAILWWYYRLAQRGPRQVETRTHG